MACKQETNVVINGFKPENDEVKEEKPSELGKQVEIVVRTWALVKQDLIKHGIAFYLRLFRDYPEVKPMFSFGKRINTELMENDEGLQNQAKLLMSMIDYAVRSLGDLSELVPKLKRLGKKHFVQFHVKPEHFQPVGASLLATLKDGLGEIFTHDVEAAWTAIYGILADVMIQGGQEENGDDKFNSTDDEAQLSSS